MSTRSRALSAAAAVLAASAVAVVPTTSDAVPPPAANAAPGVVRAYVTGGFTVATFNVLGASHTRRGGDYPAWPSGVTRTHRMVAALQRSGVDVVGFQELQRPQWRTFRRVAGAGYRLYSARRDTDNAIAWRRAAFSLVSARTVGVPYFGHRRPMPVVQLRHRATGQRLYVISVHNPAHRRFARARRAATRIEVRLVNRLVATGRPVVLAGDANARRRYFCRIVGGTDLKSAFGGSCGAVCRPPAYRGIDWIFGAPTTSFAGTRVRRTTIRHRVSDHPLVTSRLRFAVPVSVGR